MLGELDTTTLEHLLATQFIGRIACNADGLTYIAPVNYVYDDPYIYVHSGDGMKIGLMRKNPQICFEVDLVHDFFNWQSVICWGTFEELTGMDESVHAMQKLINRIEPYLSKVRDAHPSHGIADIASDIGTSTELVVYRIKLTKKTGRFENREQNTLETGKIK